MKKILIADDRYEVVELVKATLEGEDYQVIDASDGREALEKTREDKPDLILLDVMLPKIHGYKIARLLKFDLEYKNIPIIMLTARAQESDINIGEEVGADEYVTKPFDMDILIALVKKYLNMK